MNSLIPIYRQIKTQVHALPNKKNRCLLCHKVLDNFKAQRPLAAEELTHDSDY